MNWAEGNLLVRTVTDFGGLVEIPQVERGVFDAPLPSDRTVTLLEFGPSTRLSVHDGSGQGSQIGVRRHRFRSGCDQLKRTYLGDGRIVEKLLDLGFVVDTANPEEFTSYIRRSNELFGKLVRAAKIEPE